MQGSRNCYNKGCKHPECKAANTEYNRRWRKTPVKSFSTKNKKGGYNSAGGGILETWSRTELLAARGMLPTKLGEEK